MSFGRCCCVVAVLLLACASCALAEHADVDAAAVKVGASSFSLEASSGDRKLLMEHDDDIDNAHAQADFGASSLQAQHGRSISALQMGATGSWDEAAAVPAERTMGEVSAGILTLGDKPYMLVVGEAPQDSNNTATLMYDLTEDVWLIGAPRMFVGNHHASEVIDNKMYLFGGLTTGNHTIQIASLVEGPQGVDVEWSVGADLPVPSGSGITSLIGGMVYYCGGIDALNTFTYDTCYQYDPTADSWSNSSEVPPMPRGMNHAAACTDGEKMYVFGGRMGYNDVLEGFDDTQIFTPGQGWSQGAPLPLARGGMGKAVFDNGECYVFGGEVEASIAPSPITKVSASRTVYRVDVYEPATDSWRLATDMPIGLHGIFPVMYGDYIHMAGGGTEAGYSQSTLLYRFAPGSAEGSRGDGGEPSAAAAPSPTAFGSFAPAPSPAFVPAPVRAPAPNAAPAAAPRSFVGTVTSPEPAAEGKSLTLEGAPVSPGQQKHVLSLLPDLAFCPCAYLPAWLASVFVSLVAYNL